MDKDDQALWCFFHRNWAGACWGRWAVRRAGPIYKPHRKGGPAGGLPATSSMPKSVYFLPKQKRSIGDSFVIVYLSLVELVGIYHV